MLINAISSNVNPLFCAKFKTGRNPMSPYRKGINIQTPAKSNKLQVRYIRTETRSGKENLIPLVTRDQAKIISDYLEARSMNLKKKVESLDEADSKRHRKFKKIYAFRLRAAVNSILSMLAKPTDNNVFNEKEAFENFDGLKLIIERDSIHFQEKDGCCRILQSSIINTRLAIEEYSRVLKEKWNIR